MTAAFGCIFARAGSKGVPGKNMRELAGRSLIARAVDTALASGVLGEVIVSTDSEAIAAEAERAGARFRFLRPAELAGDTSPEILAWKHAADHMRSVAGGYTAMVSVPAIAPMRAPEDIAATLAKLTATGADMTVTVCPFEPNPYFLAADLDTADRLSFSFGRKYVRRQDAPPIWRIVPVCYAVDLGYLSVATDPYEGVVVGVPIPAERGIDIDTELDLRFAEFLVER